MKYTNKLVGCSIFFDEKQFSSASRGHNHKETNKPHTQSSSPQNDIVRTGSFKQIKQQQLSNHQTPRERSAHSRVFL